MSRRLAGGVGHISKPSGSSAFDVAEVNIRPYRAGGTLVQGDTVMIAFDSGRPEVVKVATGESEHFRIVGVYDGEWNQYSDAVEGDIVNITVYGLANALVDGTTDIAAAVPLEPHASTAGALQVGAASDTNPLLSWKIIAAEAITQDSIALKKVFVHA